MFLLENLSESVQKKNSYTLVFSKDWIATKELSEAG